MGTNYYLHKKHDTCPTCGHRDEPRHIGKSSMGWCFSLVCDTIDGPSTLAGWIDAWSAPDVEIRDEYGQTVSPTAMLSEITERSAKNPPDWSPAVYARNDAVPGPNNLIRHRIDSHCIAHGAYGDGTYDLCKPGFC